MKSIQDLLNDEPNINSAFKTENRMTKKKYQDFRRIERYRSWLIFRATKRSGNRDSLPFEMMSTEALENLIFN